MAITKIQSNAFPTTIDLSNVDLTLGAGEVLTANIADANVTTTKIADANVTHAKLHTDMDLSGKTVTLPDLNQNLTLTGKFIATGNTTEIYGAGNASLAWGDTTGIGYLSFSTGDDPIVRAGTGKDLILQTNGNNNSMVITSGGNVGIGSTSPDYKLTVKDTTVTTGADQKYTFSVNRQNSDVAGLLLGMDGNNDSVLASNNGDLRIGHDFSNTFNEHFRISTDGNVGIGTTTPDEALDIEKSGANLRLYNNTGVGTSIIMLDTIYQGGIGMDSGNLYFRTGGQNNRWMINTSGDFIPSANDSYDIGSITSVVRNIYTGDLHLSNEAKSEGNEVDGTKGNWTIQEGEEHLYIINNKNGKKYRFALEEIQ